MFSRSAHRVPPVPAAAAALLALGCGGAPPDARPDAVSGPAAVSDSATTWAEAQHAGSAVLRVLYVPAEGFAFRAPDGRLTGVTVEIVQSFTRWVRETHDVAVTADFVEEPDWRTFYGRVRAATGGVLGLGNVTITEERRTELAFSPPYLSNVAVLITHDSVPELGRLSDMAAAFEGLAALGFEGTLHEVRVRRLRDEYLPGAAIELARSNDEIVERVSGGCCFAYVDAYNYFRARERGVPVRRHTAGDDAAEAFGIIMPVDSDWEPLLRAFFTRDGDYRSTPEYRAILERHLGAPLTQMLLRQPRG
jgi:ABC-type amino acid transport substrate-binding protein